MTRSRAALAAGAVILELACAGLMVEAGRQAYATLGPSHAVAGADGSLYVVSHGRLHRFGADGRRRESVDLAKLGAPTKPSDIALHADGRIVLVDPDTSRLVRCTLPGGPCETIDLGLRSVPGQELLPLNAGKLAIDEAAARYYVSDNAGHAVVIADFAGHVLARSAPGLFRYPNHLFIAAPGELSVVDTNHRRIATYDVHGDRFGRRVAQVWAGGGRYSRPGRHWPFDSVALPDGKTAVLIADNRMRDADLVILDRAARPVRRLDLGADSDPFDIERWGGRLVVADGTRYRLESVSFDGRVSQDFPAHDFARELDRERERVHAWRAVRLGARIALAVVPLGAILFLWRLRSPNMPPPAAPSAAIARDEWLGYRREFLEAERRRMALALSLVMAGVIAAIALMAWLLAPLLFARRGLLLAAPPLLLLAAMPVLLARALRIMRRNREAFRMRAGDDGLRIASAARRGAVEEEFPWRGVSTDGARLLAGRHVVLLHRPWAGAEPFDAAVVESQVLARIPPENRLAPAALTGKALRARPVESAFAMAAILLALAFLGARALGLL